MRRSHIVLLLVVALCLPSVAGAQERPTAPLFSPPPPAVLASSAGPQKKPKDPVLQTFLEIQFGELNRTLGEISDKLAALDAEIAKLKQQQADIAGELRNAQNAARNTDSSLTSFRLSNQQDIINLKTDVAKILQNVTTLMEGPKKAEAAAAPEAPKIEGYITDPPAEGKDICSIGMGSAAGVKVGMRFSIFKLHEPNSQIGLLEITEVLDANNSRGKILHSKPGVKLEFSDIVRPE